MKVGINSKLIGPGFRKAPLLAEIKTLIASMMYGSSSSRGALEQERFFYSQVSSPEHMMTHRVLADDDLSGMGEGSGTATTGGGASGSYSATTTGSA